ncbi:MAG: CHAD domain-containing protein [Candidatus Accumulibacter sp. UW26]|jgi:triphosphatase
MGVGTELNLSLTPGLAGQLVRHRLLTAAKPIRQRVVKTYYDTPDQRLRRESVVVGYRRSGSAWLSSVRRLALPGGAASGPGEWQGAGAPEDLDFSHVDDSPLRDLLESLRPELQPAFTTTFTRRAWLLEPRDGVRIGLALDRGWIEAGGRRQEICEVGLELLSGGVADLFSAAGELQTELPLHPESANRFQRGYQVWADESLRPVKARAIETHGAMTAVTAFRTIVLACLNHLQGNEQGLRETDDAEFVHQARVAIRRLRSAIRVWQPLLPATFVQRFDPLWQAVARRLGEARNWDVFLAETLPMLGVAFPGEAAISRLALYAQRRSVINREAARRTLKAGNYSRLLLEFTAAVLSLPEDEACQLDVFAPRCLDKRAKQVRKLAAQALAGDATARHRLRVAYKRLRYTLEFFAPLFPGELQEKYHLSASGLQETLGRLNDLAVAGELTDEALPGEAGEGLRRWLNAQSEALLPELGGLLSHFHQQAAPWRLQ